MRRRLALTSLIDVIFLLLLFFMLTSTFSTYGEIELSQATAGSAAPGVPTERLFVQIGAERLVLNGAPITLDELATQVEAGQLLISLDDDTTAQRLVDLLVRVRGRDALSVMVLE
ncbi:ExbD/TolR family protein [Tateyamaria pelophila]|uniref:ExbD/TolR family protein n=1 Tax=Tateyamaria pelophila TaxID=328415 RepID=UPI001CC0962B|nr:biopolymer transporter ExbD [Tateyamaria pelophila]